MHIEEEVRLDFRDVLIKPQPSSLTSREEVKLGVRYNFRHSDQTFCGVPIIAANMNGIGTVTMADTFNKYNMTVALRKHYDSSVFEQFYSKSIAAFNHWYTIGTHKTEEYNFIQMKKILPITNLCIDIANGYSTILVDRVKSIRDKFPDVTIMAGNVVTPEGVNILADAGADIIKIGIGPGSVCTTRKITGVGFPQLSAIIECKVAAEKQGVHICADGGCQFPGDVAKAFCAGASFVMLGGMLAGHDQGEYDRIEIIGGKSYVNFYGMSSDTAQLKHENTLKHYRASEGKTVKIEYKGDVEPTIREILGGLRSACTYTNSKSLSELCGNTTFIRVNRQLNDMFS